MKYNHKHEDVINAHMNNHSYSNKTNNNCRSYMRTSINLYNSNNMLVIMVYAS